MICFCLGGYEGFTLTIAQSLKMKLVEEKFRIYSRRIFIEHCKIKFTVSCLAANRCHMDLTELKEKKTETVL